MGPRRRPRPRLLDGRAVHRSRVARLTGLASEKPTDPPQITGDWEAADYVDAYRLDYANEKRHRFEWSKDRSAPPWLEEYTVAIAGDV